MRHVFCYAALVVGLVAIAGSVPAQITVTQAQAEDQLTFGTLKLSVADAIALGIQNNLNVEVERHQPLITYEDSQIAWGAYDPDLYGEAGYSKQKQINSFSLDASALSRNRIADGSTGVRGLIPYLGASLGIEYTGNRRDTNNTITSLRPEYNAGVELTARVPLLKGLLWSEPWTLVKSSKIRHEAATENFRTALMDTVRNIENAYWDLIARNEDERVARKSLDTAQALLEQTRTEYEVGVKSRVDVYESEAGRAEREFELIRAQNLAENAQDVLIDTILGTKLRPSTELQIQPTDDPDVVIEYKIDIERATREAFRRRPELAALERAVAEREVQVKFAKNQRLPQFDVLGTFGTSGRDGRGFTAGVPGVPSVPTGRDNDFSDANSQLFDSLGEGLTVRAQVTIPIGNIAGRHRVSRSKLELRRSKTQLKRQEQAIIVEIRSAARNLESAQRGIVASEQRRVAAAEQLRAEEIRLEHGESTPFDVLQRERDLVDAERQKIVALQLYRNSVTDLHRFQGTILEVRNISISDAESLR